MLAYLFLVPLIYVLNDYVTLKNYKNSNIYGLEISSWLKRYLVVISPLLIMSVLKHYSVGYDTTTYELGYEIISQRSLNNLNVWNWEIGYVLINKFFASVGFSFRWFIFFTNVFFFLSIAFIAHHEETNLFYLFLFFLGLDFFSFYLSGYRQSYAISFTIISTYFLLKGNNRLCFLFFFIAITMHKSSLVMIYPYLLIILSKKISNIFLTKYIYLTNFIISIFIVLGINVLRVNAQFESFFNNNHHGGYNFLLFIYVIMIILLIINKKTQFLAVSNNNHLMTLYSSAFVMQAFALTYGILNRATHYYTINLIFLLPAAIDSLELDLKYKSDLIALFLKYGLLILVFVYFIYNLLQRTNGSVPFKFMF